MIDRWTRREIVRRFLLFTVCSRFNMIDSRMRLPNVLTAIWWRFRSLTFECFRVSSDGDLQHFVVLHAIVRQDHFGVFVLLRHYEHSDRSQRHFPRVHLRHKHRSNCFLGCFFCGRRDFPQSKWNVIACQFHPIRWCCVVFQEPFSWASIIGGVSIFVSVSAEAIHKIAVGKIVHNAEMQPLINEHFE